jgi:hypothetical protein
MPGWSRRQSTRRTPRAQSSQGFAQQQIECCYSHGVIGLNLAQHGSHVALAKAEVAQGREDLCVNFERLRLRVWLRSPTVFAAVGVSDLECACYASVQEEFTAVGSSVVRSANAHEVGCRVWPAFGAQLEMVHIEISRVSAARDLTAPFVAQHHGAAQRRRSALLGADAHVSALLGRCRWLDVGRML